MTPQPNTTMRVFFTIAPEYPQREFAEFGVYRDYPYSARVDSSIRRPFSKPDHHSF